MNAFPRPAARRTRRRPVPPGRAQTRVDRHPFTVDPEIPVDHRGRAYCTRCHCHGEPGDARHLTAGEELPPVDPDVRAAELRRFGEAGDDD